VIYSTTFLCFFHPFYPCLSMLLFNVFLIHFIFLLSRSLFLEGWFYLSLIFFGLHCALSASQYRNVSSFLRY
jgi:hypothetical protein